MKRLLATVLCCTLLILLACCHGDSGDGVMDRPNYTSINYKLTASQALLHFYDVSITYVDVSGREKTEMMTNEEWHFFEKTDGEHDIDFKMTFTERRSGCLQPVLRLQCGILHQAHQCQAYRPQGIGNHGEERVHGSLLAGALHSGIGELRQKQPLKP